jgi:hypothetical protein
VALIAWWTEVVAQRTGSGGDVEESPVGHKVGNIIAMVHSLRELEWGKGRDGVRSARRHASNVPTRKRTRGGSDTETRARIESRQACRGKRGVQSKDEASAAPCRGHASMTHVGPATGGFRRTHSDSDLTSVELSPGTGATSHRCSNYPRPLAANFSLSLFSFFFFLVNPACTSLSYKLRLGLTCFF